MEKRDITIDVLRGTAIFTMICANSAAYILAEPHPLGIRLYGTWAAPLFILISGFLVPFTAARKQYGLGYYLKRGGLVLLAAAFLDIVAFNIYPFTGVDVLYLIGVGCPLAFLFSKLKLFPQYALITAIFVLTPLLQRWVGYAELPAQFYLWAAEDAVTLPMAIAMDGFVSTLITIGKSWLISGWFPLFPWLGFVFLGVCFYQIRREIPSFAKPNFLLVGGGILLLGAFSWNAQPGLLLTREGYSEMFYPPTIGYLLTAIGVVTLLFALVDFNPTLPIFAPLRLLAACSLFIYLIHYNVITHIFVRIVGEDLLSLPVFLGVYLAFSIGLIAIAFGVQKLKEVWTEQPFFIRFLLGG